MGEQEANATLRGEGRLEVETVTRRRVQSEIEFPYTDMEAASGLAHALQKNAGSHGDDQEVAGWLNQSADGGTYRARRSAARIFGLIDVTQGRVMLTALGRKLTEEASARSARAEAFLKPELYAAMYDKFRGTLLPPPAAVERFMEQLGVSPKQKERARQAFHKSAIYAGYIDGNTGKFIKPGSSPTSSEESSGSNKSHGNGGGDGDGTDHTGLSLDPLLIALLQKIPKKEEGWIGTKRARWFRAFAMNVSQVYDDENPVELTIELVSDKPQ